MPDFLTPLDRDALAGLGVPAPWAYGIMDRVRFYELDALGHVNNVAYLRWFETLRIPYFRDYGLSSYGDGDPQLVVAANTARYIAPMFLGESYVVTGRTASFRTNSFRMEYGVFRDGAFTCLGDSIIVSLEQDGATKRPLPVAVKDLLVARDGAVDEG